MDVSAFTTNSSNDYFNASTDTPHSTSEDARRRHTAPGWTFTLHPPFNTSPDSPEIRHDKERHCTTWDFFEDASTEPASAADSLKKMFDPTERWTRRTPELLHSERMDRVNLLSDISRCQDQVEELIGLFQNLNHRHRIYPKREATPKLRKRFASKLPRARIQFGPQRSIDVENARAHLARSLHDALSLLDRFPEERGVLMRSVTPSTGQAASPSDLMDVVDRLEHITQLNTEDPTDSSGIFSGQTTSERLPVLEESLSRSSTLSDDRTDTHPGDEGCGLNDDVTGETSSDAWIPRSPSPHYRVVFQDPIRFGTLSRNSSQSLSGLETFVIRVQPCCQRDAMSERDRDDDGMSVERRTQSAVDGIVPTGSMMTMDADRSVAGSSDWDIVEDGVVVQDIEEEVVDVDREPARLTPELVQWTSTAFSTLEFRPPSRTPDDGADGQISLFSTFSEAIKNISQQQCRIDRSVQCDISVQTSNKAPLGCRFWFKKKRATRRHWRRSHTPSQRTEASSISVKDVGCGLRTAVRAVLHPPCPHGRRDRLSCPRCCRKENNDHFSHAA